MRLTFAALLLAAAPVAVLAHPNDHGEEGRTLRGLSQEPPGPGARRTRKEQLLVPPADAQHDVLVSDAKH